MSVNFKCLDVTANQSSFSKLVGVSRQAIGAHASKGIFDGCDSLQEWLQAYCEKLREEASGRVVENADEMKVATIREKNAKAYKTELEIEQLRKTLVDMNEVYRELEPAMLHILTTMKAAGNRIASALSAQYGIQIDKRLLDNEFRTALSAIADYDQRKSAGMEFDADVSSTA